MLDTGHAFRRREPGASKGRASLVACSQNKWCLLLTPMAPQIGSKLTSELIWQPAYKPSSGRARCGCVQHARQNVPGAWGKQIGSYVRQQDQCNSIRKGNLSRQRNTNTLLFIAGIGKAPSQDATFLAADASFTPHTALEGLLHPSKNMLCGWSACHVDEHA